MALLLEYSINHYDLEILKGSFRLFNSNQGTKKKDSVFKTASNFDSSARMAVADEPVTSTSSTKLNKLADIREQMHFEIEKENQLELERLFFGTEGPRDEKDYLVDNNHWLIKNGSSFDKLLIFRWLRAMQMGAFKFNIEKQMPTRYIEGKYNFLCQINGKRITEKRPTELKKSSISLDFDPNKFNFTKINDTEILFKLSNQKGFLGGVPSSKAIEQYVSLSDPSNNSKNPNDNFIIINNSPIELGHILLLPNMYMCNKQVLNMNAIRLAIDVSLLTHSNGLFIGFNSLGAYASVNHLHMHAYYCGNKLMSERQDPNHFPLPIQNVQFAEALTKKLWLIDEAYFFPAFAVQLCDFENNCESFAEAIIKITTYLNQNEIPHNVVIVKTRPFAASGKIDESGSTIRVNIWPRKSSYETPENGRNLAFAICEMAGHFFMKDEEMLNDISEEEIIRYSQDSKFDAVQMEKFKRDIIALF